MTLKVSTRFGARSTLWNVLVLSVALAGTGQARAEGLPEEQTGSAHQDVGLSPAETLAAMSSRSPEIDLDGDGKIDLWREFRPGGGIVREQFDRNGDGKPDEKVDYGESRIVRTTDADHDGTEDERFTQFLGRNGAVESTLTEKHRAGKWETVEKTRLLEERDLVEIRTPAGGKEEVRYDHAKVQ